MSSYADIAAKGPEQPEEEKVPHPIPEVEHDDSPVIHDPLHEHSPAPPASYAEQQLQAERTETARRTSQNQANEISKEARDFMESSKASAAKLTGSNSSSSEFKNDVKQTANQTEKDVKQTADQASKEAKQTADKVGKDVKQGANQVEKDVKQTADKAGKEARQTADKVEKEAKQTADKAEKNFKQAADKAEKNVKQAANQAGQKYEEIKDKTIDEYKDIKGKAVDQYENNVKPAVKEGVEKSKQEGKKAEQWAEKNKDNPVVIGNAVVLAILSGVLGIGAYRMHSQGRLTWGVAGAVAGAVGAFAVGDYFVSQFFFKKYPPKN